jgi:hypothetical protein
MRATACPSHYTKQGAADRVHCIVVVRVLSSRWTPRILLNVGALDMQFTTVAVVLECQHACKLNRSLVDSSHAVSNCAADVAFKHINAHKFESDLPHYKPSYAECNQHTSPTEPFS